MKNIESISVTHTVQSKAKTPVSVCMCIYTHKYIIIYDNKCINIYIRIHI